ncbi:hypothetical protein [Tritonibacter mobilis]|uniref:hypothetical protein n=1 Tax=Tritonibacter mobilis TaxID=379347 RepID=UPI003A5BD1EE
MDDLKDLISLINAVQSVRSEISQAKQLRSQNRNTTSLASRFKPLVSAYAKAKVALETIGMQVPSVEISGKHRVEIVMELIEFEDVFSEVFKDLSRRQSILETEAEFSEIVAATLPSPEAVSAYPDILILNQSQKHHIQEKLNELRLAIESGQWDSEEHLERVLRSLNVLQTELDAKVGSYTRKLGQLVELGDAIGEFGKRIKPATDRVKDIMDSLRVFKRENAQIEKQPDPLRIEDKSDEIELE